VSRSWRDLIAELERLATSKPDSGRAAIAKASALRELLRLDERSDGLAKPEHCLWDEDRDPAELVTERDRHPDPEGSVAELAASDTVATRRSWWLALATAPRHRGRVV
jgi:hypothetical protein